jgi:hypothetical protein
MPFCPNCRDEFQDWVKVCPDCHVELTDRVSQPISVAWKSFPVKLVTVADFYYSPIAHLYRAKLESEGITCFVYDEFMINADWFYLIAVGGVKLKVSEADAPEAMRIIKEVQNNVPESSEQEQMTRSKCYYSLLKNWTLKMKTAYGIVILIALMAYLIGGGI